MTGLIVYTQPGNDGSSLLDIIALRNQLVKNNNKTAKDIESHPKKSLKVKQRPCLEHKE